MPHHFHTFAKQTPITLVCIEKFYFSDLDPETFDLSDLSSNSSDFKDQNLEKIPTLFYESKSADLQKAKKIKLIKNVNTYLWYKIQNKYQKKTKKFKYTTGQNVWHLDRRKLVHSIDGYYIQASGLSCTALVPTNEMTHFTK